MATRCLTPCGIDVGSSGMLLSCMERRGTRGRVPQDCVWCEGSPLLRTTWLTVGNVDRFECRTKLKSALVPGAPNALIGRKVGQRRPIRCAFEMLSHGRASPSGSTARALDTGGSAARRRLQSARTTGSTPRARAAASSMISRTGHSSACRKGNRGIRQVSCQACARSEQLDESGLGQGRELTCSTDHFG